MAMDVFSELLVLLIAARLFGEAAERLGQPASVGEITVGILLAVAAVWFGDAVPFLGRLTSSEVLTAVANVGIFALVLLAGIEMEPREIAGNAAGSFAVAAGGLLVPLIGGIGLAWIFLPDSELRLVQALMTGVALSISAVSAIMKVFSDLDLLHTRIGRTVVAAAVFDDVLGVFLLAIILALLETGHIPGMGALALLLLKVVAFFAITILLGKHVYPPVSRKLKTMQATALEFSALTVAAVAFGWLAHWLGMHWVLGAFMAGIYCERERVGVRAYEELRLIFNVATRGFLGPLFFVFIGIRVDLSALTAIPLFLFLLVGVALIGKVVGAGIPARCMGFSRREAIAVGIGMSARGAVELIVLSIAYEAGLFSMSGENGSITGHLFSALVLTAVITTMLAPSLLRKVLPKMPN
jgi:Kef-type K+ transport system membrane component KefB